jgi:hypothetical protein
MMAQYQLQLRRDTNSWTDEETGKDEGESRTCTNPIF